MTRRSVLIGVMARPPTTASWHSRQSRQSGTTSAMSGDATSACRSQIPVHVAKVGELVQSHVIALTAEVTLFHPAHRPKYRAGQGVVASDDADFEPLSDTPGAAEVACVEVPG